MTARFRRRAESTDCHPPGMRPTDPPAMRAYDWGADAARRGDPPQPGDNPGYEADYQRGYEGRRRQRRHRRPLRHRFRRTRTR